MLQFKQKNNAPTGRTVEARNEVMLSMDAKDFKNASCLGYVNEVRPWRARGKGGGEVALISYYVLTSSGQLEEETYYFATPAGKSPNYYKVCAKTLDALGYYFEIGPQGPDPARVLEAFNDLRNSKTQKRGLLVRAYLGKSSVGVHTNRFEKAETLDKAQVLFARWLEGLAREDIEKNTNTSISIQDIPEKCQDLKAETMEG